MKSRSLSGAIAFFACAALAVPLTAEAHHAMGASTPATAVEGLISGVAHPIIGFDHLVFVLAIGVACYYFGQKAGTILGFLGGAVTGTVLHLHKTTLAYPDVWIALTLVVLGFLFFRGERFLKSKAALALFALAGIAHGYAYGESIVGAEATPLYAYLAGYTLVQLALAFCGYAIARHVQIARPAVNTLKALGGGLSVAGAALLVLALS
jgi:urease accessory protein